MPTGRENVQSPAVLRDLQEVVEEVAQTYSKEISGQNVGGIVVSEVEPAQGDQEGKQKEGRRKEESPMPLPEHEPEIDTEGCGSSGMAAGEGVSGGREGEDVGEGCVCTQRPGTPDGVLQHFDNGSVDQEAEE